MNRDNLAEPIRRSLERYPKPYASHYGVVPPEPTRQAVDLKGLGADLEAASRAIGRADALAGELPSHFMLSRILVRQEAVSSSAIEETHSTLDELLEVEAQDEDDEPARAEARQVRDYAIALEAALAKVGKRRHAAFTVALIQALQRSLMAADPDYRYKPGSLRDRVVWIGSQKHIANSTYNPTPPDRVRACLKDNVNYLQRRDGQEMQQALVTRMAIAHAHFEAVHPFPDGNGRVGRLMLPLMMAADGHAPLYLSPYVNANKNEYYNALKAAQQKLDYRPLVGLLARAIVTTVADAEGSRTALDEAMAGWERRRAFRQGSAAKRALAILPGYPILTIRRLSEELEISFPAASRGIEQLVDAKILVERTGYERNRMFIAPDVLAIYNR